MVALVLVLGIVDALELGEIKMEMIQFEVNMANTCPMQCHNCLMSKYRPAQDIMAEVIAAVDKEFPVFTWITGGEPSLFPDKIELYLKNGNICQMPSAGVYNEDQLVGLLEKYPNFRRINVSILGTQEYEKEFRKVDKNYKRNWMWKVGRDRLMIMFVIFKESVDKEQIYKNIDYVFKHYHYFPIMIYYDRYSEHDPSGIDAFDQEELIEYGHYIKDKQLYYNCEVQIYPVRVLRPTVFASGSNLMFYHGKISHSIPAEEVLKDPAGFVHTLMSSHYLNSIDTSKNCDVHKQYQCGGPFCRLGYKQDCRNYWSQFIIPSREIKTRSFSLK